MLTRTKRKILFWISVLIFLLLVPVTILYALGYRVDPDFSLRKTGGLYISSTLTGSEIFVDKNLQKRTNLLQSGVFIQNLAPKKYGILVLKEGYLAWAKDLNVKSQFVTEAHALLVPMQTNGKILSRGGFVGIKSSTFDSILLLSFETKNRKAITWYVPDTEEFMSPLPGESAFTYKKSFELIRWLDNGAVVKLDGKAIRILFDFDNRSAAVVPLGEETALKSADEEKLFNERLNSRKNVKVFYDPLKKELAAKWLEAEPLPYYFEERVAALLENKDIRNFEFFPKRREALIASYGNGIWAVEIDSRGGRIIQSIYKGKFPDFALPRGLEDLYVIDDGILMRVKLNAAD